LEDGRWRTAPNARAVKVMPEVGIDISGQHSKHVDTLEGIRFEYVVTLCDNAREACPFFPADSELIHVGFDDPPNLGLSPKNEVEALEQYRRVRDGIRAFAEGMPRSLESSEGATL